MQGESLQVVALDRELEYALEERKIPYSSGRHFRPSEALPRMKFVERFVEDLFESEAWKFFLYRDIPLGKVFAYSLREYLNHVLYYVEFFERVEAEGPWCVLGPAVAPPRRGGPLGVHMYDAVVCAARVVALARGAELEVPRTFAREQGRVVGQTIKRVCIELGFRLLNSVVRMARRSRPRRFVVSDYWWHIEGVMRHLPEAELVMVERGELVHIPLKDIFKHRIQFAAPESFNSNRSHRHVMQEFQRVRPAVPPTIYNNIDITSLLQEALDTLIGAAVPAVLRQIDQAYALIRQQTDAVLLRVSVGGQTHYGVLALVAKKLGVPAIELQHGLEYLGEGSYSGEHAADVIALYGPAIRAEYEHRGYRKERLLEIGSPRFDVLKKVQPAEARNVLCFGPDLFVGSGFDSYAVEDYFSAFFAGLPEGVPSVIKIRGPVRETFFRAVIERARRGRKCVVGWRRPLTELFSEARVVVSCYSTVVLESLQCGIPTILLACAPLERHMAHLHFGPYVAAGAFAIAEHEAQLQAALQLLEDKNVHDARVAATHAYMQKNFLFDGNASQRLAAYLRSLRG